MKTAFLFVGMPVGGAEDFALGVFPHLAPEISARFVCIRSLDILGEEALQSGFPVDLLPIFPNKRISPLGVWRLSRWLIDEKIEVVHSQTYHAHLHGLLATKLAKIPLIVHQQKTIGSLGARKNFLLGLCFRYASSVVTLSEQTADEIRSRYGLPSCRLHVVPNAINDNIFQPAQDISAVRRLLGLPTDCLLAGTIASLHPVKNHHLIIEALSRLPAERRPAFIFIGDGPARSDLESLAEAKGVRVFFVGRKRPVIPWFQALDFFVLASHWEGQPLAILQALSCDIPVLASRIEGNTAVLGDKHAGLFDPRDCDSLTSLISLACEEPERFRAVDTRVPTCREAAGKLKAIYSMAR